MVRRWVLGVYRGVRRFYQHGSMGFRLSPPLTPALRPHYPLSRLRILLADCRPFTFSRLPHTPDCAVIMQPVKRIGQHHRAHNYSWSVGEYSEVRWFVFSAYQQSETSSPRDRYRLPMPLLENSYLPRCRETCRIRIRIRISHGRRNNVL